MLKREAQPERQDGEREPEGASAPDALGGRLRQYVLDVKEDTPDLRDRIYRPALRPLGPVLFPKKELLRLKVRDQGGESSCAGQALASMIDFLRVADSPPGKVSQSSARMLIEFARRVEQRGNAPPEHGVNSLRSAIKAFYHNGVCLDEHWPYVPGEPCGDLTPERSKHARKLALGAYFRLEPVLNDYHAALNEAGAIYVAAHVHDRWDHAAVRAAGGRIGTGQRFLGGHAFVIVGYDGAGFLVLNSWGEQWGRYKGVPGLAHWPYSDWAESVLDGWVLRLAVSTPQAFHIGVGFQGPSAGMNVPVASASTPRIELVGHYLHLDDGVHVRGGRYPSSPDMLAETVRLLERKADDKHAGRKKPSAGETKQDYDHVLLWLAGANETTKDAVADAARLKRTWTGAGVYPITVFWCSDFVEEILGVLDGVFSKAEARVGRTGAALDDAIESAVRGAGRAFLRDIKRRSALAAAWPAGDMADAVRRLGALKGRYRLHLAAEGVGAIMAADLATFPDEPGERGLPLFETVTLLSPVLTERRFDELLHSLPGKGGPKVAVVTHDDRTEQRMRVGPYSRSILHLVDRAFEEGPRNNTLVGLREVAERLRKRVDLDGRVAFGEAAASGVDQPKLHHVTRGPDAIRLLTARIGAHDRPFAAPCGPRPRHARAL